MDLRRTRIGCLALVCLGATGLLIGCGDEEAGRDGTAAHSDFASEGAHIHGLGVNPADGALFIATHSGLFRADAQDRHPVRVGTGIQDTMGFTVAGPDRFFASGHPAQGEPGPPHLGLIESRDGGETWQTVSLAGKADFHVLRYGDGRIYGYNGLNGAVMVSGDNGASWHESRVPAPLFDFAVDPSNAEEAVASSEAGLLQLSTDQGQARPLGGKIGLLAWPERDALYLVDGEGAVAVSDNGGRSWQRQGRLPEAPAAFFADSPSELYAALASGTILRSVNEGRRWSTYIKP